MMEKVDGTLASLTPGVTNALNKAVALMQQKNYVHGDLRPQNIIITDNSVRILDITNEWHDTV